MSKTCSKDCQSVCDFCIYFDWWNKEKREEEEKDFGDCKKHKIPKDVCNCCNDFICMNVKESELDEIESKIKKEYKRDKNN